MAAAVAALVYARPDLAAACPHCYGSSADRVFDTYYLSTVMLSVLPFVIAGVIAVVALRLERRGRQGLRPPLVPGEESGDVVR